MSATPDLLGTGVALCSVTNSALKGASSFKSARPFCSGAVMRPYQLPQARCTGHATLLIQRFQSAWRYGPVNGRRKPRLLLDPVERYRVLLPPRQAGHVAIAGIPQVNRVLKRRNTNTCAPQQTVPYGRKYRWRQLTDLPAVRLPDVRRLSFALMPSLP